MGSLAQSRVHVIPSWELVHRIKTFGPLLHNNQSFPACLYSGGLWQMDAQQMKIISVIAVSSTQPRTHICTILRFPVKWGDKSSYKDGSICRTFSNVYVKRWNVFSKSKKETEMILSQFHSRLYTSHSNIQETYNCCTIRVRSFSSI